MLTDAHIHLVDLEGRDPGYVERLAAAPLAFCAASHDEPEFLRSEAIIARIAAIRGGPEKGSSTLSSFGIHPQWAVWKNADWLALLADSGRIDAIGEAGFDLFGDRPERVRNPENEASQRAIFEFQLSLARRRGLPMVLHVRKAFDLVFAYARELAELPSVVLHAYSGSVAEAEALLARKVNAYFSFGTNILNGHKRAVETCARLAADRILSETDAPWQPPRGQAFCRFEHIELVVSRIASIRDIPVREAPALLAANFHRAYAPGRPAPDPAAG